MSNHPHMSNHPEEERLALYFRDDLAEDESPAVREHVHGCAFCREVLREFQRNQELLERFSAEPTAEQFSEVRRAVMSALADHKKRWSALLTAAAAAAVVLFAMFHVQRAPVYVHPAVVVRNLAPESIVPSLPRAVQVRRKIHHSAAPGLRSVELIAREDEAPLIKMTTSDPNVVILLQTERTANYE